MKHPLLLLAVIALYSLVACAQERTAREYAKSHGIPNRPTAVNLSPPHACTLSKQHPCIYYGGDIDPSDPQENGLSNENTVFIPDARTYNEVNVPVPLRISAAFTNNLQTYGLIDPQTANWDFRVGIHDEGGGILSSGTSIASGTASAQLTDTGHNAFGFEEYELVTRTPVTLPAGDVWFDVQPNCTNANNPQCNQDDPRYLESDTDSLNGINTRFTVTSNNDLGPVLFGGIYFEYWMSWCITENVACGDGMSAGLLK